MTIKHDMEAEARKLAETVRDAVGEFAAKTGMQASVAGQITKGRRYLFADNDKSGAGERAAQATGLPYCMSPVLGEDANDMHVRAGLLAVCGLLMRVRTQEVAMP